MRSASEDVFLNCPYSDKDEVKALGARWSTAAKRWFVPAGTPLAPFARWLPESHRAALTLSAMADGDELIEIFGSSKVALPPAVPADPSERFGPVPDNAPQYTIRDFVAGVRKVVLGAYDHDVWLVGQITSVKERRTMYVIEIMDADQAGATQAARLEVKAFRGVFETMLRKLRDVAGQDIAPGLTVRVKVRPEFDLRYHLGARLLDIDPTVTVGAFELRLRQIRQTLDAEGVLHRNRTLPAPLDYCRIAVIHPVGASGFEDFRRDADQLVRLGLCEIHYLPATFDGANAERTLLDAFARARALHEADLLDTLVVIRGGGSKQGLMALSTEALGRAVCTFPVPVITGLGHADDDTLLDELAWRRCDTPSKTIAYIRDAIATKARGATDAFQRITAIAGSRLAEQAHRADALVRAAAHAATLQIQRQRETVAASGAGVRHAAETARARFAEARQALGVAHAAICAHAPALLAATRAGADRLVQALGGAARSALAAASGQIETERSATVAAAARGLERSADMLDRLIENIPSKAADLLETLRRETTHMIGLIQAVGAEATLARGFALALDAKGKAVTTAKAARRRTRLILTFKDGVVPVAPIKGE